MATIYFILSKVPKSVVAGYEERIPSVLVMMQKFLMNHNGREQVKNIV